MVNYCKNCGAPCRDKLCENCYNQLQKLLKLAGDDEPESISNPSPYANSSNTYPQSSPLTQKPKKQDISEQGDTTVGIVAQCFHCGLEGNLKK